MATTAPKAPATSKTTKATEFKDSDLFKVKNKKGNIFTVNGRYLRANEHNLNIVK